MVKRLPDTFPTGEMNRSSTTVEPQHPATVEIWTLLRACMGMVGFGLKVEDGWRRFGAYDAVSVPGLGWAAAVSPYTDKVEARYEQPPGAKAGLGVHMRMHDLRHAHASWLLAGGADLKTVMDRLGHSHIQTTQKYLHTLPEADEQALAALTRIESRASR
jgi:integrase